MTCKVSQALGPAAMYERGFHPTAVAGCFGATAAAGRVLGLSVEQMMHAFGIALSEAAGSMQYLRNGAWTKRFQAGNAGRNGLVAATFAKHGFTGAVDPLEGRFGLFHAYVPDAQPEKAVAGLREVWEIATTGIKPYPACRLSHAPADLAAAFYDEARRPQRRHRRGRGRSQQHRAWCSPASRRSTSASPRASSTASSPPISPSPSCCGRASWRGTIIARQLADARTLALTRRVRVFLDPRVEANYPNLLSGSLKVVMRDGTATSPSSASPRATRRIS